VTKLKMQDQAMPQYVHRGFELKSRKGEIISNNAGNREKKVFGIQSGRSSGNNKLVRL